MILFIKLTLAHLIGDFILQPTSWVTEKDSKGLVSSRFYHHLMVHLALAILAFWDVQLLGYALLLVLLHGLIDWIKIKFQHQGKRTWFFIDQFLHLLSLVLIVVLVEGGLPEAFNIKFDQKTWLIITAYIFVTKPASILIKNWIIKWTPQTPTVESLPAAGSIIGILERLFVLSFIISGNLTSIGFLFAAKSVFRFGSIKESQEMKMTEYILIGTLMSFGLATVAGLVVLSFG